MAETSYEFAIFGSTPLAGLLAGLLATVHQKRVCIMGEASSAFRLPRGIDLSAMPATRPESWALLKQTTPEVLKLIGRLHGRAAMRHVDPVFVAETTEGADALSHMRHVALDFGYEVDRLPDGSTGGVAYRLADAVLLDRTRLEPAILAWLAKLDVGLLSPWQASAVIKRDGSVRIEFAGRSIEASHAVLADDAAILTYLEAAERDRTLRIETATALLTEPTRTLVAPAVIYVDRGVTLVRGRTRGVAAIGIGRPEQAIARVGGCLAGHGPLRRAGQRIFRTIETVDGAPLIGPARGLKATVLAGLGVSGAFLAPAIARLVAGQATDDEKRYFAAREAGRGNARALVAEFAGSAALEA
ncbi:MAG: hypothetical protein P4M09_26275 [Devosia sp.]|nr:hypothetical protein [Devosia sp.]